MTSSTVYKLSQLIINRLLKIGVPTHYSVGPTEMEYFIGFAVHYFPPVKETPLFNISSKRDQVLQISLDQCFECTWYDMWPSFLFFALVTTAKHRFKYIFQTMFRVHHATCIWHWASASASRWWTLSFITHRKYENLIPFHSGQS